MNDSSTPKRKGRAFWLPASPSRIDAEVEDEFRFHITERVEQFVAAGMSREQAEEEVKRRFGDYELHREQARRIDEDTMRQRRRSEFIGTLAREIRRSARVLVRTPSFSVIAFVTMALGIGATAAIYTVLDAVVLRPLPYPNASQLVSVLHPATVPGSGERKWGLSNGGYFQFRSDTTAFSDFGMYRNSGMIVTNPGADAEMVREALVTTSMFTVLGAKAAAGRLFNEDDGKPGAGRVAVLSQEFFERRFHGDSSIIGQNLVTDAEPYQIVGVAERGLTLPMPGPFASSSNLAGFGVDVWVPLRLDPAGPFYNSHPNVGVARLRPGVTIAQAQRDLAHIMKSFAELMPQAYSPAFLKTYNFRVEVSPLRDAVLGPKIPRTMWMLFGAVLLVLVIAATNVANLFLVRMEIRRREAAIRTALGADRTQMAAHYLSESLLLCISAAIAGVFVAFGGIRLLLAAAPTDIPRLATVTMSWSAAGVALGIGLVIGIILGVLPLFRRDVDINGLRDGGKGMSASPRQRAARGTLVVSQIALALVLLSAAGLMIRSFGNLRNVQPGFSSDHVATFTLSLPFKEFDTREKALVFHQELQRRISEIPGVISVGATTSVPLQDYGTGCTVVWRENRPPAVGEEVPCVATPIALPGFFDALKIKIEGRAGDWSDVSGRTQAVVVTQALADRLWPKETAIGKGIGSNGADSKVWYRIVGVIPELKAEALDLPATEAVFYAPTALRENVQDGSLNDVSYFVRTSRSDPLTAIPAIRKIVASMNPQIPFMDPRTMDSIVQRSLARTSFIMILLGIAATVALSLSVVGIYGVISYVVTQRRAEIGIRMALGASIRNVVQMIVMQSMRLAIVGVTVGILGALAMTGTLRSLLFGISPNDPAVLISVPILLLVIVMIASLAPARRAAKIDPVEAIRQQ